MFSGCSSPQVYGPNDTNISAKVGESFIIKLDENITTGYRWSYTISDESVVKMTRDEYVPDDISGRLVGSGGKRILTFKALSKGNATIKMVYERSFEKNPNDTRITYRVAVS